jgi:L-lactate dehydrogenase complex protein LldE
MQVDLFIPCFIDQLFPDTGFNMVKVLEKAGCTVHYNPEQTCCGQPAFNAGYWDKTEDVSKKFITDFSQTDRPIVAPSGSCVGLVRNSYGEMFDNTPYHNYCKQVKRNLYEFSEFMVNVLKVTDLGGTLSAKVTYHDACAALRECNIKSQPRQLLEAVKGVEIVEMAEAETCCGFGGTFSTKFEAISTGMADQKGNSILETGADIVVSTDYSCLMHLQAYFNKQKMPIKVMHLADLLAASIS